MPRPHASMAVRVSCHGLVYSLFEIEEVLFLHHAVRELLAFTVTHIELGDVVGVAIVADPHEHQVTIGELRAFGTRLLPTSLLPTVLVWVDALPLDVISGVLRDELPRMLKLPVPLGPGLAGSSAACRRWEVHAATGDCGDARSVLRLLWQETLQLPSSADGGSELGGDQLDNVPFGAYGGDSLLAAQLIGLAKEHGLVIPSALQFSLERLSITQLLPLVTQLDDGHGTIRVAPLTVATASPALAIAGAPAATQPAATGEGAQQPAAPMSVRIIERDCRNPTQPLRAVGGLSACAAGDLDAARRLASEGWAAAHAVDKHGNTALQWAAGGGHLAAMRWLLGEERADVDASNKDGRTALMWACKSGRAHAVSLLLDEAHADASLRMKDDSTAFDWAAQRHVEKAVRYVYAVKMQSTRLVTRTLVHTPRCCSTQSLGAAPGAPKPQPQPQHQHQHQHQPGLLQ